MSFTIEQPDFIVFARSQIAEEKIDLDIDFVIEFMFSLDSKEQFCIPIEKLVETGIDSQKIHAKKRLEKGEFTEGEDFSRTLEKSSGGRPTEKLMLTTRCFKKLCMSAQNKMGNKVQNYYLLMEELYKKHLKTLYEESKRLIEMKDEEIGILKNSEKHNIARIKCLEKMKSKKRETRASFPEGNFIYINIDHGFRIDRQIKIGITTNLKERLSVYDTSRRSCYAYYRECGDADTMNDSERFISRKYKQYKVQENHEYYKLPETTSLDDFTNEFDDYLTKTFDMTSAGIKQSNALDELELEIEIRSKIKAVETDSEKDQEDKFMAAIDQRLAVLRREVLEIQVKLDSLQIKIHPRGVAGR